MRMPIDSFHAKNNDIITQELMKYMQKLKELCDEAMISYSVKDNLFKALHNSIVEKGKPTILAHHPPYKSCIKEILYSPFSDTFFIYVRDKKMGLKLLEQIRHQFKNMNIANERIDYEIVNDFVVIEIIYSQDTYYKSHICKNIHKIISLNLTQNDK